MMISDCNVWMWHFQKELTLIQIYIGRFFGMWEVAKEKPSTTVATYLWKTPAPDPTFFPERNSWLALIKPASKAS